MTTINKQISASADDCDELNDTTLRLTGTTIYAGSTTSSFVDCGLRWQSVDIAQATTISSATLSVYINTHDGTLGADIRGIDEDNTATWSDASRPSHRTKTTATITANEANWANWGNGNWATIDITSVIQEIVNRGGWVANNDIAIVIEDSLGAGANNYLVLLSYDYAGNAHGAKLDIVYGLSVPVMCHQLKQQGIS